MKIGLFSKDITDCKPTEYIYIPTQLYSHIANDLRSSKLTKYNIELETLKILNMTSKGSFVFEPFLEEGVITR